MIIRTQKSVTNYSHFTVKQIARCTYKLVKSLFMNKKTQKQQIATCKNIHVIGKYFEKL